jgi:hypothetical protein
MNRLEWAAARHESSGKNWLDGERYVKELRKYKHNVGQTFIVPKIRRHESKLHWI